MRTKASVVKHPVPKTTNRPKTGKHRPLPALSNTMSGRTSKTHVAGIMAGTVGTKKQKKFTGITRDVRRLQKAPKVGPKVAQGSERSSSGSEKEYPVVVNGRPIGVGKIIRAKSWGKQNRVLIEMDGKVRGWGMLRNGKLQIITKR